MGATPLMSLGMRAMAASYAALQVTGHNIANNGVAGYSRQRVEQATAQGQFSGAGYFGKGADVVSVTRNHNAFLTREAMSAQGLAAKDQARLEQLRRLETVFPTGEKGVGHATLQFLNAFSDLANLPADASSRQVVLARAQDLAGRFADAGGQIDQMQHLLREDLKTTVATVNELTSNIARINQQIAEVGGLGQPPNDLLDSRDRMLAELSKQIAVSTVAAADGTIGVFAGGGQRLVLGKEAQPLAVVNSLGDPARATVAVMDNGQPLRLDERSLGAGRIAGMLSFQNQDLVKAQLLLGQMAAAVAGAVNAQQKLGLTLHEPAGSVAAQDMFAVGAPHAQPMGTNRKDPLGNYVGKLELTIVDASQLQASEYDLRPDPINPGGWQVTRLADGLVRSVNAGDQIDGFRIDPGTPPPLTDDKFLLQPVTRAASDMTARLTDPRDIAASAPLTASADAANTGTARIGALTMTSTSVDPTQTATITFGAGGAYNWERRDRVTNALIASGSGHWAAGEAIPSAPDADINGFALAIEGMPAAGDQLVVGMTTNVASNNGNALALAALRDQRIVGRELAGNGGLIGGASATDAYAAAMADIGVRVQGADALSEVSGALAIQAEQTRSAEVGVNLDEEAAMLIAYQQSYQAAAKVLQIAQSVFDTLLQTAGA